MHDVGRSLSPFESIDWTDHIPRINLFDICETICMKKTEHEWKCLSSNLFSRNAHFDENHFQSSTYTSMDNIKHSLN